MTKKDSRFLFVGNHQCLDFINTQIVQQGKLVDLLRGFSDFVAWMVEARAINPTQASEILRHWGNRPEAVLVVERAREFRSQLRHLVGQIASRQSGSQTAIDEINRVLRRRNGHMTLVRRGSRFRRESRLEFSDPMQLLVPIAEAAGDLICDCDFTLIRKCENPACVLYYYDTSKNHARRWCSMALCGNRIKVAAHYRRHH